MASKPGVLTDWPWKHLGSYKFMLLAPWAVHSTYSYLMKDDEKERDLGYFLIFPFILFRMLHNQIWISISRYRTAKGSNRIVDKTIEFEQVDRETNWDDQILFNGIIFYIGFMKMPGASQLPIWRTDGVVLTMLLHTGPVEFLYYWLHRALHHHFLYSRYHSHHHSSIVTEPITSVIHPFAEHISYFTLFAIPLVTTTLTRTASIASFAGYISYIDWMNNMGHCNFELIPKFLFTIFPPLKYLMYTPTSLKGRKSNKLMLASLATIMFCFGFCYITPIGWSGQRYHSLHHTQFRTNYSLFMPIYDYIYGTMDNSTDTLYETSLQRPEESPDVVHLTHLTTPESIYHLRVGFAAFASRPYTSKWYLWVMWPWTFWSMMVTWIYGRTFVVERNVLGNLKLQTWAIPKYNIQYFMHWQKESINNLIEDAILEAEDKGTKVLSLGLMNQGEELNKCGELYVRRHPQLRVKVVDGSSLAVAVVLNSIPKGTTQVLLTASSSKVASSIALILCQRGIQVSVLYGDEYNKLKATLGTDAASNLVLAKPYNIKTWLVGDGLGEEEQLKASKGTLFIPFSQFPPKKMRKDCSYYNTPAMVAPKYLENVDSCENWLPRRVMSAWRIAGIVHGLEGWNVNECGNTMFDIGQVWEATLRRGFHPLKTPIET